jgi:MSHA biogenesis protein MshI
MAMQQINLYQASLRPARQVMTMMQLALAASVVLLVLVSITGVQAWWLHRTNQHLSDAKLQETQLTQANERISKQLAQNSNDTELKQTISNKETELQDKQYVLQALTGKQFGNTSGFAAQFTGLARQHVEGVWLTGLYIHAGGEKLNLQGRTSAAELVPRYLQRLAKEPSFQGIEFQTLLMQRVEKSSQIDFDLRSTPKEPG